MQAPILKKREFITRLTVNSHLTNVNSYGFTSLTLEFENTLKKHNTKFESWHVEVLACSILYQKTKRLPTCLHLLFGKAKKIW